MTTVKQRVSADLRALEWWGSFEGDDGVNSSKETIKLNNRPNMFSRCSFQLPFYSRYSSIDWLTDCFCICFCFALLSLGTKKNADDFHAFDHQLMKFIEFFSHVRFIGASKLWWYLNLNAILFFKNDPFIENVYILCRWFTIYEFIAI